MKNADPLQRQKRKKTSRRERVGRGKKGENKIKRESGEERRATLREKQVIQGERERERERERKKREGEGKETERKRKGRNKNEKEREIRVNVSAGGQKWPTHFASQGPRFFAACLANAGRLHERLRTASVA